MPLLERYWKKRGIARKREMKKEIDTLYKIREPFQRQNLDRELCARDESEREYITV